MAALSRPAFRSLWLAALVSQAGDWLLLIALPIVVYRVTGSALGTALAFLAELGPTIALGPVAGRMADRIDRRRLMLVVTALQAASLAPLLLVHGHHGLGLVFGVIVAQSALAAIFTPASGALLPTLVDAGELVSANSLLALGEGVARLVGGPLGGVLLAVGNLHAIVIADAASYALAGALIARLPADRRAPARRGDPAVPRFRAVLRNRRVRGMLALAMLANVAQGIFLVLFVVFVARRLGGGAGETGLLRGVQAVGAIAAGGALALLGRGRSPGSLMAVAAFVFGVISLLVWNLPALTTAPLLYAALFALVGAPGVVMATGMVSFLQLAAAERERGRALGAFGLAGGVGQAVGMIAAGLLTGPLGLSAVLDAQGAVYLATGIAAAVWLARLATRASPAPLALSRSST